MVNCIYYWGWGDGFYVNEYVNRIYYGECDSGLGCGKGLWKSGEGVGFCLGRGCGKVVLYIKGRKNGSGLGGFGLSFVN